jgi:predicted transcriptional regulator
VYKRGSATVWDFKRELPSPPSYSAVRSIVNVLESKGLLRHRRTGNKYVYSAAIPPKKAMRSAVEHLVSTHFGDSFEKAVAAILEIHTYDITEESLDRLSNLIENMRKEADT